MVAVGSFREDLYFRLAVLPAFVPPLRARRDDIPGLLSHFLSRRPDIVVDPTLMAELAAHPWTGNVRELRSFVDRAVAIGAESAWALTRGEGAPTLPGARTGATTPTTPPPPHDATGLPPVGLEVPFKVLRERWVDHLEREFMKAAIEKHGRNVGAIAELADLDRSYIHRLLRKHGL